MANNKNLRQEARALKDYALPQVTVNQSVIRKLTIEANNFEIKPSILSMIQTLVQFSGPHSDDPNAHITNILEICDIFKLNEVSSEAI